MDYGNISECRATQSESSKLIGSMLKKFLLASLGDHLRSRISNPIYKQAAYHMDYNFGPKKMLNI